MDTLRLAFLVIGGIAIVGIVVHGMWSVRKNTKDSREVHLETSDWQDDYDDDIEDVDSDIIVIDPQLDNDKVEPSLTDGNFDDLGVGAVRVVSADSLADSTAQNTNAREEFASQNNDIDGQTDLSADAAQISEEKAETAAQPKIYSSVVTQPKPEYAAQQVQAMRSKVAAGNSSDNDDVPEPPPFLLKAADTEDVKPATNATHTTSLEAEQLDNQTQPVASPDAAKRAGTPAKEIEQEASSDSEEEPKISLADQARNFVKRGKAEGKPRKRREPKIREDQMRIDFDEPIDIEPAAEQQNESATSQQVSQSDEASVPEQEVLILNVRASDDAPIQGAALLPMLLTLGFKFGDQDIFHRHVNSNGKGPVLFSLANMFKPGVFDIDNLENFNTMGVSLFMMLPIEGDPHQVFNMMHNAARKIADEFSAQVLDGRRSALTKQSLQQYVEKIREFERKRMIAK